VQQWPCLEYQHEATTYSRTSTSAVKSETRTAAHRVLVGLIGRLLPRIRRQRAEALAERRLQQFGDLDLPFSVTP
jgi:hypothetical protein